VIINGEKLMAFQDTITRVNGQPLHHWERFQIAYHMGSGMSPYQIASALSIALKTAYKWIRRFEETGEMQVNFIDICF
jgi:transposase-like protein